MYPVLIVEGVAHKVVTVNFRDGKASDVLTEENGKYVAYFDEKHSVYFDQCKRVNLSESLKWVDHYELLAKELLNRVEGKEENLISLENQYMIMSKQKRKLPFNDDELSEVLNKHDVLESELNGMYEAIGIMNEMHMQEDVDLQGGEDIE